MSLEQIRCRQESEVLQRLLRKLKIACKSTTKAGEYRLLGWLLRSISNGLIIIFNKPSLQNWLQEAKVRLKRFHKLGTSQETAGWEAQFCSGQGWVSLRGGLPMKVQTQRILWSQEDRGSGSFTLLEGGVSSREQTPEAGGNWP